MDNKGNNKITELRTILQYDGQKKKRQRQAIIHKKTTQKKLKIEQHKHN